MIGSRHHNTITPPTPQARILSIVFIFRKNTYCPITITGRSLNGAVQFVRLGGPLCSLVVHFLSEGTVASVRPLFPRTRSHIEHTPRGTTSPPFVYHREEAGLAPYGGDKQQFRGKSKHVVMRGGSGIVTAPNMVSK